MARLIFDIEADGLLPEATRIHCMSTKDIDTQQVLTYTTDVGIVAALENAELLIGFNITGYDLPLVYKIYNLVVPDPVERVFDLWEASLILNPNRQNSVEAWASRLGMDGKVDIQDWVNLPIEEYIKRCEQDVEIEYRIYLAILRELGVNDYKEIFYAEST